MPRTINKTSRIAVYLRKSREDINEEDTLQRHRKQLQDYVEQQGFKNVTWFEEIGSADSIENRPIFSELLPRIEDGEFDAVLVVAYDRLTRGSQIEAGIIQETFKESGTIILTPSRTYDLTNEGDEMLSEFESVIARSEYRAIKRRLKQGKINAVRNGRPHSGNPPFGYYWDRNDKSVKVHEEQSKIYRLMIEWYLQDGLSANRISEKLSEMNIPTASGRGAWHGEVVTYLLVHDFHRGFVYYGKFKYDKNKKTSVKNTNPDTTVMVKGNHKPLKTEEEHAAILKRTSELRTYNRKNRTLRKNTFRLSGLIYCPYCGKCQGISHPKGRNIHIRKCLKRSSTRTLDCDNKTFGIAEDFVYDAVIRQMNEFRNMLFAPSDDNSEQTENTVVALIELHEQAIDKSKRRIERIKDMFIEEIIDRNEMKAKIEKEEASIRKTEKEISKLKSSIGYLDKYEEDTRKETWASEEVVQLLSGEHSFSHSDINDILRKVIDTINYWVIEADYGRKVEVKVKWK